VGVSAQSVHELGHLLVALGPSWLILVFKLTADFGDHVAEVVG
jgi:hypothetical protein